MVIDRRRFLSMAVALGLSPTAARAALPADGGPLYLSARKRGGRDEAVLLDEAGHDRLVVPMPARGHSFAIDAAS